MSDKKLNLIVPMAGFGSRFKEAGYDTYKPFIKIKDRPLIDYVLEPFPENINKYFIVNLNLLNEDEINYLNNKPNSTIIPIEPHKLGPAYSIYSARDSLPLDESFFISYSDIYWTWDFSEVEKLLDYNGIVFTRRKFHPHLVDNNYSAFCKTKEDNVNILEHIKEKESFTDDWMSEPLSVGSFYMKKGHDLVEFIERYISEDIRVSNEFFPSVIFNDLVAQNKEVYLSDVDFFMHLGVPEQLEDFNHWITVMTHNDEIITKDNKFSNICCMGGTGSRMQQFSNKPKMLLELDKQLMYEKVLAEFACNTNSLIAVDNVVKELSDNSQKNCQIINLGKQTESQMETLQKSSDFLREQKNFFLTSCDAYGIFDKDKLHSFINKENPDAVIFTFNHSLLQNKLSAQHTHVSVDNNSISDVHIKNRTNDDNKGLAGFFWFKDGSLFNELNNVTSEHGEEIIVDHFLKHLVKLNKKVMAFNLDHYIHVGTVPEYLEYKFWEDFKESRPDIFAKTDNIKQAVNY